jgi:hypothetical protein
MLERLAILALVCLAAALLWGVLRLWQAARLRRLRHERPLAGLVPAGRPAVVAFSTPGCAECRTRQAPALARLRDDLGEGVTVASLLANEHPALVERLGILTVPATVVLDTAGGVQHVNQGFADAERLAAQLRGVEKHILDKLDQVN